MKKILCVLLVLSMLLSCAALAEGMDYNTMTAEELKQVIVEARAALAKLEPPFEGSRVIYDENDIQISIGAPYAGNAGWIYMDVTVINKSETEITVHIQDIYMNGWKVNDDHGYISNIKSQKNANGNIIFMNAEKEASITAAEQIEDFSFVVRIINPDGFKELDKTEEQTISFVW